MKRVFATDSQGLTQAQLSPNGRWVVYSSSGAPGTHALWLGSTSGGAPVRITSEGFEDRAPRWHPSGVRVFFESSRPNRNGGRLFYLMALDVDTTAGRAAGVPRQVGITPVVVSGLPSPDGQWIPQVTATTPPRLEIIPSTGGTARRLGTPTGRINGMVFGPDSRDLYVVEQEGLRGAMRFTAKKLSITGGSAVTIATADHAIRVLPADPRVILHEQLGGASQAYELRTQTGRLLGRVELPRETRAATFTGDGWGIIGIESRWTSTVKVATVAGGEERVLASGGHHWPEAWTPDGSAVITDRAEEAGTVVEALPVTGGAPSSRQVAPASSRTGWYSSVGPWYSYFARAADGLSDELHAIHVATGEKKRIASHVVGLPFIGRGGREQDESRWIVAQQRTPGTPIQVMTIDPNSGAVDTVRAFSASDSIRQIAVHGRRIAFARARGDSMDLLLADSNGPERRIATLSQNAHTITWSWDGTMIAVGDRLMSPPREGRVHLFGSLTAPAPTVRHYDLGANSGCDGFQWTRDDRRLLMLCYGSAGRIMQLTLDGRLTPVVRGDMPQQVWEFYLSPDDKHVAFPVQHDAGRAIWVADFRSIAALLR